MAQLKVIKLLEFDENKALNGATLAFSTTGTASGKISNYVLNFKVHSPSSVDARYSGQVQNETYYFNGLGECSDKKGIHKLFLVDVQLEDTKGTTASRGDAEGNAESIDINTLQPREHFAIAALRGIMFHITNPLDLTPAQINQICTKSFEVANGMMSAAAEARAESKENPDAPEDNKKDEVEINPDELTSNSDKILYNIWVQNNNRNLDDKARFDKLTNATYSEGALTDIAGIKIHVNEENPIIVKTHPDSEIKKVTEITNELNVNVTNMPSVPSEPVIVTGTVSVDNFPSNEEQ